MLVLSEGPLTGKGVLRPEVVDDVLLHRAERVVALKVEGPCKAPGE